MPLRNVAEYLERSAARVPDKTAFSDAAGAVSYRQMLHDAQALGTVLAGLPGCRNAPVAVMIGRTAASVTAMQGVLQSGCYRTGYSTVSFPWRRLRQPTSGTDDEYRKRWLPCTFLRAGRTGIYGYAGRRAEL